MTLEIGLLGAVEAHTDGAPLTLGGARQRRLLAHLALSPGRVRSFDSVTAAVWPDGDVPVDPRQAIRTYVSRLRGALGADVVVARDGGYALVVPPSVVDAGRFEMLVREASDAGCARERAVVLLSEALGLWRGNALDGFDAEEWARADAVRLEELKARAADDRAEALLALGRPADAIADLEAAVAASPLREHTHALLMSALHRSGRQAEALRVYQRYRRRLATDLGLEPGADLQRVEAEVAAGSAAEPIDNGGRPLRGYLLGERIGDGSFAVVYRGTQPGIGRDVAVKVIRAELANRPEFIRRFEVEAHLVARLEHPHIVPLYDYWREPGSAYLVMRLLRGGTLDSRIGVSRLNTDEALRLVEHVGDALTAAHRSGIVHRDVKPANVFLDGDGNYFLGDFGIALEAAAPVHATDTLSLGSPAYASPEQLRREAVGPSADVHGLAITLFEALAGHLPFPEARSQSELLRHQLNDALPSICALRPDLPHAVDLVLSRAAAKDPSARYASTAEFVDAFAEALQGTTPKPRIGSVTVIGDLHNPYKGLRAFQEADASDFHGRQRLVDRLVAKLGGPQPASRFLTVVGPSGSGKSSVVRAGLLPAVRAGALPGSSAWFLTSMMPGAHPFEELESALNRIAIAPTAGLAELMASDRRGIARAVKQACPVEDAEVVVVIDQFEELFTLCADDVARQRFVGGLVEAISDPRSRLRVVATLRADFYDRPLRYPELAPLIEEGAVTVSPLAPDELERAITEPAARVGAAFEPGLVAQIVADVLDQPGALPLLQYSLTELFDQNVSGLLTLSGYEALGGLSGALARRAEQLFADATPEEQEAVRRLFTRLVTLGEGTEDTRRRVRRSEFAGAADAAGDTARLIDAYGAARLLAFDRDPVTREPTVEVAHEALIREWPRLREWLDDDRDGLRVHRHLTDAAAAWEASGRDAGELYRGGRLEAAEAFAAGHDADLNAHEAAFVTASVDEREQARRAEVKSRRRIHRALVAVAAVAVVAVIAGLVALRQQNEAVDAKDRANVAAADAESQRELATAAAAEAESQRVDAEAQRAEATAQRDQARIDRLVAESHSEVDNHLDLAMLLAAEAWHREQSPSTQGALLATLTAQVSADLPATAVGTSSRVRRSASRVLGFIPVPYTEIGGLQVTSDGSTLALFARADPQSGPVIALYDTNTRVRTAEIPFSPEGGGPFALSPDGRRLLLIGHDSVAVVDVATGEQRLLPRTFSGAVVDLNASFTPDSSTIIVRDRIGRFSAWDAVTLQPQQIPLPARANTGPTGINRHGVMSFADVDQQILRLYLWDVVAGKAIRSVILQAPADGLFPFAFRLADDGSKLFGVFDSFLPTLVWDTTTGAIVPAAGIPRGRVMDVDPIDPSLLVFGSGGGQLVTYDTRADRVVGTALHEFGPGIRAIAGAANAGLMATIADDQVITLWGDSAGSGFLDTLVDENVVNAIYANDIVIVTNRGRTEAQIRAAASPNQAGTSIVKPAWAQQYDYLVARPSNDGSVVAVFANGPAGRAPWLAVVDASTGQSAWTYDSDGDFSGTIAVSDDGDLVAVADQQVISVVDVASGTTVQQFTSEAAVSELVFTADARFVDAVTAGGLVRYDFANPAEPVKAEGVLYSQGRVDQIPGTDEVVGFGGLGLGLGRWDMSTGELLALSPSRDGSNLGEVAVSRDGTRIAAGHFFNGNISLYDTATMDEIGLVPAGSSLFLVLGFTPDGRLAADALSGGTATWDLDPEHWAASACRAAGRNLTKEEWVFYLGDDEPYRATCAEWPPGQ